LNFNSSEKDVFNFFAGAGIGRLIDIKIIRDPRTGKSKGVAYVEFESQESILLAVALSGQPIKGKIYLGKNNNYYLKKPATEPKNYIYSLGSVR
jgi:RNA recognition motif-containing protein